MLKIDFLKSKKERAFYFQGAIGIGYILLRFKSGDLASFDTHFGTMMAMLASYHLIQGVQDTVEKHKAGSQKQGPPYVAK